MKIDEVKEKFQTELKWASYYLISSFIISFIYTFFQILIFNQTEQTFVILLVLNIFIFLYCSSKCISEINSEKAIISFSKLIITINIFTINYLLLSLLTSGDRFIIPKREIEIQQTTVNISDKNSNLLKDFIAFVKLKRKR